MKTTASMILASVALLGAAAGAEFAPDFHADVAPVLREYCAGCHNDDDFDGDLSVETFGALMEGGESGEAVAPGDGAGSLLIGTLLKEEKPSMPPKKEPQPKPEEIEILKSWIDAGAKGPSGEADRSILSTLNVPAIAAGENVSEPVTAAAYAPDGKRVALARFGTVELRYARSKKHVRNFEGHPGKVNAVNFSADGDRMVTASGVTGVRGVATLWNVETGEKLREFSEGHRDILYDAELTPDGRILATAGYDRRILIWDVASGERLRSIDVHNGAIFDLAFSPDGKILASASADETIKLWRVADGVRLDTLNQPEGEQYCVGFTPDGRFVFGAGADNRIRLWRLVSRDKPRINPLVRARFAHEDEIVRLAALRDGKFLYSSSADRTLKRWTLPGLALSTVIGDQPDVAAALSVTPDGMLMAAARMDGSVEVIRLKKPGDRSPAEPAAHLPVAKSASAPQEKAAPAERAEIEPNDAPGSAQAVELPVRLKGTIGMADDADLFRFRAKKGEEWVLEVDAARQKSPLDSKIEVLDAGGEPVLQVVLQAVRDSWFTFRGKNSEIADDFRVQNWREMELNEYLYANGEVVKLWLYPRGPDSGFKVYPGFGKRRTYFGTTALAHPLGEPCYIVRALPPELGPPPPNGLPLFEVYYENDDEPTRRLGKDSHLIFKAPDDGEYLARLTDVRGEGSGDHAYALAIRPRAPDFKIKVEGMNPKVSPGSGKEITLKVERQDGFDGEIRVDIGELPKGFTSSSPIVIEAGQDVAVGVIHASSDLEPAPPMEKDAAKKEDAKAKEKAEAKPAGPQVMLTARATIDGREVEREAGTLGTVTVGPVAKLKLEILPDGDSGDVVAEPGKPLEFTIAPGETITARVKATRVNFDARIELGKDDANRNLPHGLYVDNIGLNGLLIVEGQDERRFFITAAKWVPETTRSFHLRTKGAGGQASRPAVIHVRGGE